MLADPQGDTITNRPAYVKYLEVEGLLADIKKAECEAKGEIRSHFLAAHNLWYNTIHICQTIFVIGEPLCDLETPSWTQIRAVKENMVEWLIVYAASSCWISRQSKKSSILGYF